MQQGGLDDSMNSSRDTNKEDRVTRPSMIRRDSVGPLRRPTIVGQGEGGNSRPGSVTSALLAATLGRGGGPSGQKVGIGSGSLRRPGGLLAWGGASELNSSRETESAGGLDTTTDTLDARLSQLALGRGRGLLQQIPLRRPSGLGKM